MHQQKDECLGYKNSEDLTVEEVRKCLKQMIDDSEALMDVGPFQSGRAAALRVCYDLLKQVRHDG